MRVIIDGVVTDEADASISIFDWIVIRGFGVFEVIRAYQGKLFRLDAHLDRLERSAEAMAVEFPDRGALGKDLASVAAAMGDCQVRVMLSGGGRDASVSAPPRVIVMGEPLPPVPDAVRVIPMIAPWHPATDRGGFAGVKWTSYGPNMATTDKARRAGFDDALLMSPNRTVLEGPTFSYAWIHDGRLETPSLELGILPSITREVLFECAARIGIKVKQGSYPLKRLVGSDEAIALSTVKQVIPVIAVGEKAIPTGPLTGRLAAEFATLVAEET